MQIVNTITFWLAKVVAKLNEKNASQSMEDDHQKSTAKAFNTLSETEPAEPITHRIECRK